MVVRDDQITAADFLALATLANTNLLPVVNAAVAANIWPGHAYTVYSDAPTDTVIASPQPEYAFDGATDNWLTEFNRIREDYFMLAFNSGLGADALFFNQENMVSGPWVLGINDPDNYPPDFYEIFDDDFVFLGGILNSNAGASDVGAFPAYKSVQFICRDTDMPDGFEVSTSLMLFPFMVYSGGGTGNQTVNYSTNYAGTFTGKLYLPFSDSSGLPDPSAFTIAVTPDWGWTWETKLISGTQYLIGTVTGYALAAGSGSFHVGISPPAGVPWNKGVIGQYSFLGGELVLAAASGTKPVQAILQQGNGLSVAAPDFPDKPFFTLTGDAGAAQAAVCRFKISDPTVKGVWVGNSLPVPGVNVFLDSDLPNTVGALAADFINGNLITVSDELFEIFSYYIDNGPTSQPDNTSPMQASSMRQQTLKNSGNKTVVIDGVTIILGPKYNLISEACQPQATPWPVQRDTDPMPLRWGEWGNTNQFLGLIGNLTLAPGATWSGSAVIPENVTGFKLQVRSVSSLNSWPRKRIFDGGPLASNLTIYVSKSDTPDPGNPATYDFSTANNEVVIPGDGGVGYLGKIAGVLPGYTIKNTTGAAVSFDVILEVDTGAVPLELNFFPTTSECFSYMLDGTPAGFGSYANTLGLKPVPRSGYCIYRLRATRLPTLGANGLKSTPSSGDEITVTLGQNKLQFDGSWVFEPFHNLISPGAGDSTPFGGDSDSTAGGSGQPFTITIPANARDSGTINVFLPVLTGGPLVYQSAENVIVEAWANWQPLFFAAKFGLNASFDISTTVFRSAMNFVNFFDVAQANMPDLGGAYTAGSVRFPMSVELYNDLMNCLNLL